MAERGVVRIRVNGVEVTVEAGSTVAAAMLREGVACRVSTTGERRTAVCGMGVCFECRAMVEGLMHQRTCQLVCREGMVVETQR